MSLLSNKILKVILSVVDELGVKRETGKRQLLHLVFKNDNARPLRSLKNKFGNTR